MHPVLVGLDMPAADIFRDRSAEGVHREGVGEAHDVAFSGRVVAVRNMDEFDHVAVEKPLEEDWRVWDPERVEPALGVIPGEAEVLCRPNREAKEIAGQAVVADAVDRSEIFGTETPAFWQQVRPLGPEALGPAAGGVVASIRRAGVKISIWIAGSVFAVHFLSDNYAAALEDREIAEDLVIGGNAGAPGQMGRTGVFDAADHG